MNFPRRIQHPTKPHTVLELSDRLEDLLTVFVVDDDAPTRDSLGLLLGLHGYRTRVFDSAETFLVSATRGAGRWAGCLLTDLHLSQVSGFDLMDRLAERGIPLPVIAMSAHGDAAIVRQAFKRSAVDFLAKPIVEDDLVAAIGQAFDIERRRLREELAHQRQRDRTGTLTRREREICSLVTKGLSNHEIAIALGISHRTAQVHRGHIMRKMQAATLADLIAIYRDGSDTHQA